MSTKIKQEREFQIALFFKSMFSNSETKKESDLEKEIEKIRKSEDPEHMSNLLHMVETPIVKKANFGGAKNIKAKFQNKQVIQKSEQEEQLENENSLEER